MKNTDFKLPLLSLPKTDYVNSKAFHNDQLNREKLATHLTGFLDRLKEGAVLAIDAPWGEGKTWFGRNWAKQLESLGHEVIFIDAFEQDYLEDPFMLISAEIIDKTKKETISMQLIETATKVTQTLLPLGTKLLVNTIGQWALGTSNVSEKFQDTLNDTVNSGAELSSEWVKNKLLTHNDDKQLFKTFKIQLTELAATNPDKPIVVFIDELDRCKPTFAVELIERIKHFFDVPNIVFVLLLNRDQLEKAIKGIYGADTDASAYLSKFVNFFFRLPKIDPSSYNAEKELNGFINKTFEKYGFPYHGKIVESIDTFTFFAIQFQLSLRDIERAIGLFAFTYPVDQLERFLIYWICVKQKDPKLFQSLVKGDIEAHQTMLLTIERFIQIDQERSGTSYKRTLLVLQEWHEAYRDNFETVGGEFGKLHGHLSNVEYDISIKEMLPYFTKKLDLCMEI